MLNGYSGFWPASYARPTARPWAFPTTRRWPRFTDRGVTHVVVHGEATGPTFVKALENLPALQLVGASGPVHLYRLR